MTHLEKLDQRLTAFSSPEQDASAVIHLDNSYSTLQHFLFKFTIVIQHSMLQDFLDFFWGVGGGGTSVTQLKHAIMLLHLHSQFLFHFSDYKLSLVLVWI